MEPLFRNLRERLLRAGVAPRHVRRYLAELEDHLSDLLAEEEQSGRSSADASAAAQEARLTEETGRSGETIVAYALLGKLPEMQR